MILIYLIFKKVIHTPSRRVIEPETVGHIPVAPPRDVRLCWCASHLFIQLYVIAYFVFNCCQHQQTRAWTQTSVPQSCIATGSLTSCRWTHQRCRWPRRWTLDADRHHLFSGWLASCSLYSGRSPPSSSRSNCRQKCTFTDKNLNTLKDYWLAGWHICPHHRRTWKQPPAKHRTLDFLRNLVVSDIDGRGSDSIHR